MKNWSNLNKGYCINNCNEPLKNHGNTIFCEYCNFKIGMSKYKDLIKGKDSTAYKRSLAHFNKLKTYNEHINSVIQSGIDERKSNLRRMLAKGLITKEEFELKYDQ